MFSYSFKLQAKFALDNNNKSHILCAQAATNGFYRDSNALDIYRKFLVVYILFIN